MAENMINYSKPMTWLNRRGATITMSSFLFWIKNFFAFLVIWTHNFSSDSRKIKASSGGQKSHGFAIRFPSLFSLENEIWK